MGLGYLDYVVKNIKYPCCHWGIKEHNMDEVLNSGARCIAMVTEIVGADDIEEKIGRVKSKFGEG